jgi:hypothetical protein
MFHASIEIPTKESIEPTNDLNCTYESSSLMPRRYRGTENQPVEHQTVSTPLKLKKYPWTVSRLLTLLVVSTGCNVPAYAIYRNEEVWLSYVNQQTKATSPWGGST